MPGAILINSQEWSGKIFLGIFEMPLKFIIVFICNVPIINIVVDKVKKHIKDLLCTY